MPDLGLEPDEAELLVPEVEHIPEGQILQRVEPGISEYVPSSHKTHTDEFSAPSSKEYEPTGQPRHVCELFAASAEE